MNDSESKAATCDYCGLPLPRMLFDRSPKTADFSPAYCCTGCRFAAAVTQERGEAGAVGWTLTSLGLSIFFTMSVMVFTIAHWMYGAYDLSGDQATPLSAVFGQLLQWLSLLFAAPVLLLLGKPLLEDVVRGMRERVLSADLLLLTGVVAAYTYSIANVIRGEGSVYFEVGCMILVAVTIGRWLAATGKLRANSVLDDLQRLLPKSAHVLRDDVVRDLPLDEIRVGETVIVRAGERVPIDGSVLTGMASLDEQVFTGESAPLVKGPGDRIFAGTLNLDGSISVRATELPRQGAFGALLQSVREARSAKGRYQNLADRVSAAFFPAITVLSLIALVGHGSMRGWPEGLMAGLSVVLIACPCALGLATPLAIWAGLGRAARRGILFRSGEALEQLSGITAVRFDKTGTITTGSPRLALTHAVDPEREDELLRRASLLSAESNHVFSRSIRAELRGREPEEWLQVATVAGAGVEALWPGEETPTRLGSWRWLVARGDLLEDATRRLIDRMEDMGRSVVAMGWKGRVQGVFGFDEQVRPSAADCLARLRDAGLDLAILTGDHTRRAAALSAELGIPARAELRPDDKSAEIVRLRSGGETVAMVGDGINDAPALSAADVGIALGCGTDVTRDSADVCLLGDDLGAIREAIDLSHETIATIRGNLGWSFGYNAIGVALAMAGWLHPSVAALLMVVSSGVVISRSVRLSREPEDQETAASLVARKATEAASFDSEPAFESAELAEAVR